MSYLLTEVTVTSPASTKCFRGSAVSRMRSTFQEVNHDTNQVRYSCVDAITRGEVDACFVMCADLGAHLPKKTVERLFKIPVVSIETAEGPQAFISDVVLPGVLDGMENEGCFYRMDLVPIHARSFCKPPFDFTESNEDTLKQLFEVIKKKRRQD